MTERGYLDIRRELDRVVSRLVKHQNRALKNMGKVNDYLTDKVTPTLRESGSVGDTDTFSRTIQDLGRALQSRAKHLRRDFDRFREEVDRVIELTAEMREVLVGNELLARPYDDMQRDARDLNHSAQSALRGVDTLVSSLAGVRSARLSTAYIEGIDAYVAALGAGRSAYEELTRVEQVLEAK